MLAETSLFVVPGSRVSLMVTLVVLVTGASSCTVSFTAVPSLVCTVS